MKSKDSLPNKKRQRVWIAQPRGGKQVYLDELVPKGEVSLWWKVVVLGVISLLLFVFFWVLYSLIF